MRKGKLSFTYRSGCVLEAFANVIRLEIGVVRQNLTFAPARRDQSNDSCCRNAEMADARDAAHLGRVDRNAPELAHRFLV
jgi:hypothetical protein